MQNNMRKTGFIQLLLAIGSIILFMDFQDNTQTSQPPAYKNPKLSVHERTKDLLSRMTIEEKVAQMTCYRDFWSYIDEMGNIDTTFLNQKLIKGIGQLSGVPLWWKKPESIIRFQNNIQHFLLTKTRLGIPVIIHNEGSRCAYFMGSTTFPADIALASTWDTTIIKKIYSVIAEESRTVGIHQIEAPVIDIAREPRWGRVNETYGEDPYLVSQIGMQAVKGLQGEGSTIDSKHVIATLKHFAAYGQPEGGINEAANNCSERILRDVFFPPFKDAIQKAGAYSVMASYNEIDGIPSTVNKWLLTDILRKEWEFKGTVVTDYGCLRGDINDHRISNDTAEITRLAVTAGVNMEYPQPFFYPKLIELVQKKIIPESRIDELVYPILLQKFKMGLFENPYVDADSLKAIANKASGDRLALDVAHESIILLKNTNEFAPIKKSMIKTIAVIGPHANSQIWGSEVLVPKKFITVYSGVKQKAGNGIKTLWAEGCKITIEKNKQLAKQDENEAIVQIDSAVRIASQSDVVILALGGSSKTSSFNVDNSTLDLPGYQENLVDAIYKTGKPIVLLIFGGKTFAIPKVYEKAQSIFYCWYLGQETGNAIADVLFGDYNPGGKLPITIPRSVGHLPAFYNHKPQQMGHYVLDDMSPLYPFGFGLSYTTFQYKNLKLQKDTIRRDETCLIHVDVTNTGKDAGDEIVQMYIHDKYSSVTRPVKELKDFYRIHLNSGETKNVEFTITPEKLSFYDINMNYTTEPGDFEIMVGTSSVNYITKVLTVKK
jgi:beta-glucosidase